MRVKEYGTGDSKGCNRKGHSPDAATIGVCAKHHGEQSRSQYQRKQQQFHRSPSVLVGIFLDANPGSVILAANGQHDKIDARLQRRFSRGFAIDAAYTSGKSNTNSEESNSDGDAVDPQVRKDLRSLDKRQRQQAAHGYIGLDMRAFTEIRELNAFLPLQIQVGNDATVRSRLQTHQLQINSARG